MGKKLVNTNANGLHVTIDNLPELEDAIDFLLKREVLVGVPGEKTERPEGSNMSEPDAHGVKTPITNASLAYIHDNGAPEARIPARPFMIPGMTAVQLKVTETLAKAAEYALQAKREKVNEGYERVGLLVVASIQGVIRRGINPALADRTLIERLARAPGRKGETIELERRAKGAPPGIQFAIPLMDTNEMLKSISYVVRKRSDRKK